MSAPERGPDWFEPRIPRKEECSLGHILAARASQDPDGAFAVFDDGKSWSNREAYAASCVLAEELSGLGVAKGDYVAVWQPNGPNMLRAIFACSLLGAVAAQINIAFRGGMLAHALKISNARVLFAHGDLVERLDALETSSIAAVLSSQLFATARVDLLFSRSSEDWASAPVIPTVGIEPWELAAIIFTSGTTGPSKGVRVTACQLWSLGLAFYGFMTPSDRMLVILPLFHIASLGALYGTMASGASLSVMESLRTSDFWSVVRRTGVTTNMGFAGAFMDLLMKAPPSPDDRDHGMRRMLITSTNASVRAFTDRFGIEVFAGYSMSETSVITISGLNPAKDHCVGRVRKGIEIRLVNEHDIEVPAGQPGELIVRSEIPWALNDGYQDNPEGTVSAWRNGWFHTGDLLMADADGDLFYVDRLKDAIRRRGENISSAEVEAEVRAFASIRDAAAVGVQGPDGEEVLVVVCPYEGAAIDPVALIQFLTPRMPHFMVPRYVRILDDLPKTQTNKVQKGELRAEGLTSDCWDRETAGITLRRQRLKP